MIPSRFSSSTFCWLSLRCHSKTIRRSKIHKLPTQIINNNQLTQIKKMIGRFFNNRNKLLSSRFKSSSGRQNPKTLRTKVTRQSKPWGLITISQCPQLLLVKKTLCPKLWSLIGLTCTKLRCATTIEGLSNVSKESIARSTMRWKSKDLLSCQSSSIWKLRASAILISRFKLDKPNERS